MSEFTTSASPNSTPDRHDVVAWEFVPMGGYVPPTCDGLSAAARKWNALKALLGGSREAKLRGVKAEADLRALPQVRLENLAPPIDWEDAARGLDSALSDWLEAKEPTPAVCFVIGQPWCGHVEMLEKWAGLRDADLVAPPGISEILGGKRGWLDSWSTNHRLWVLPGLERCYLRHANGITLVRNFLECALCGHLGKGVVGCDSWAWAFLRRVWPFPPSNCLTLQAFDGDKLTRLFAWPAKNEAPREIRFCHAKTGTQVVPAWRNIRQGGYEVSMELKQLATHCRGNPGTAWAYWRNRLRAEPDASNSRESDAGHGSGQGLENADTIWFAADMIEPTMPMEADEDMAIVLHGLLLHDGLSADVLASILPLPHHRVISLLLRLKSSDLLIQHRRRWKVSALGYATVQGFLRERGYLTDQF